MKSYFPIIFLLLTQASYFIACNSSESNSNELTQSKQEKKPVDVFVVKAEKQLLYTPLQFAGLLKASEEIRVYTELAGTIKRIHAEEGSKVYKGQTLVSVTPGSLGLAYKVHQVKAPSSGILVRIGVEAGQYINAHQELGLVSSHKDFETVIYGTESDLAYIKKGIKLNVILSPSTPQQISTTGEVVQVGISPDPKTLAYKIKVKILCAKNDPCSRALRIGTLVKVEAKQNERLSYLVPSKYLHKRATQVIVVEDGKAKWLDIKTGEVFGDKTEIVSGIDEKSIIISSFAKRPHKGEDVHIVQNEDEQKPLSTAPDQNGTHL